MNGVAHSPMTVLIVGATGSIGQLVVDETIRRGHTVRALVRTPEKAALVPGAAQVVMGDVTRPDTLIGIGSGVGAIVFTLGSDGLGEEGAEAVNYGGVRNVLGALNSKSARIALMTAIGVTDRSGSYPWPVQIHDWKRRSERLVRASGLPYTIVRPGWFDRNAPDQHKPLFLQGDKRHSGDTSDGAIARQQIAQVLVASLSADEAARKTFELVAETGAVPDQFDGLFAGLAADPEDAIDGVWDDPNMPINEEPEGVRDDMVAARARSVEQG